MGKLVFRDGQTVVFAGDSITDCGRRGDQAPYGNGYVRQVIDLIGARYPSLAVDYHNEGISGNTVVDLQNRWYDDVLRHKPDWVTIKIGINDLHRSYGSPADAVPPSLYEAAYRVIVKRTLDSGAKIVLIDPFYISQETDPSSQRTKVLALLPEYIAVVAKLSKEFDLARVETHALYMEQLKYRAPDTLCPEPVHPNVSGHLVIAHGLLEAIGW